MYLRKRGDRWDVPNPPKHWHVQMKWLLAWSQHFRVDDKTVTIPTEEGKPDVVYKMVPPPPVQDEKGKPVKRPDGTVVMKPKTNVYLERVDG